MGFGVTVVSQDQVAVVLGVGPATEGEHVLRVVPAGRIDRDGNDVMNFQVVSLTASFAAGVGCEILLGGCTQKKEQD